MRRVVGDAVFRLIWALFGAYLLWTAVKAFNGLPAPWVQGGPYEGATGPFYAMWSSRAEALWVGVGFSAAAVASFYFAVRSYDRQRSQHSEVVEDASSPKAR